MSLNQQVRNEAVKASARILVVDDSHDSCTMMAALLGQLGYAVETARTVAEALKLAGSGPRHLYIIESYYTDGRGAELCRQLRALDPAARVLFYSTAYSSVDLEAALRAGAQGFILKPDIDDLLHTIARLLGQTA